MPTNYRFPPRKMDRGTLEIVLALLRQRHQNLFRYILEFEQEHSEDDPNYFHLSDMKAQHQLLETLIVEMNGIPVQWDEKEYTFIIVNNPHSPFNPFRGYKSYGDKGNN